MAVLGGVMGKIISIVNQKGGVGKTTTTINLGASLAAYKKKVLLIDMDPQCNASTGVGYDFDDDNLTMYDILIEGESIEEAIVDTELENYHYIPSDRDLVGLELEFADNPRRNFILKEQIGAIKDKFDYILIDCPPSLNSLTLNALIASDSVIIPLQTEYYAMEGLVNLNSTLNLIKKSLNPELKVEGILFTMYDKRTTLARMVVKDVVAAAPYHVYSTIIPRNITLSEAPSHGEPAILYSRSSIGARAYIRLANEIIGGKRGKK